MRRLVFCFDGTRNARDDEFPTNIRLIYDAARTDGQEAFYFAGPGNHTWRYLGAAFGVGSGDIANDGQIALEATYRDGDEVFVFGFSRGAAIARMFCARINKIGLPVNMLGCFDTVGAFVPIGERGAHWFHDLHVAPNVRRAYHVVAMDEDRAAFEPTLMNRSDRVTEIWGRGVHTDIGGGASKDGEAVRGLSDLYLDWMLEKARWHGMNHDAMALSPDATTQPTHEVSILRERPRRVGVMVDDRWSDYKPVIHPSFRAG